MDIKNDAKQEKFLKIWKERDKKYFNLLYNQAMKVNTLQELIPISKRFNSSGIKEILKNKQYDTGMNKETLLYNYSLVLKYFQYIAKEDYGVDSDSDVLKRFAKVAKKLGTDKWNPVQAVMSLVNTEDPRKHKRAATDWVNFVDTHTKPEIDPIKALANYSKEQPEPVCWEKFTEEYKNDELKEHIYEYYIKKPSLKLTNELNKKLSMYGSNIKITDIVKSKKDFDAFMSESEPFKTICIAKYKTKTLDEFEVLLENLRAWQGKIDLSSEDLENIFNHNTFNTGMSNKLLNYNYKLLNTFCPCTSIYLHDYKTNSNLPKIKNDTGMSILYLKKVTNKLGAKIWEPEEVITAAHKCTTEEVKNIMSHASIPYDEFKKKYSLKDNNENSNIKEK